MPKQKSLLSQIKDMIIEYILTRTSFYGLSNIFKTKFILGKIYWSLIVIICIACVSFTMLHSIKEFLDYEVVTKTQYHSEIIPKFPAVTICNQNPFITEYSNQILNKFFNQPEIKIMQNKSNASQWENIIQVKILTKIYAFNMISNDEKEKLGYKVNEAVMWCTFNLVKCDLSEFKWSYNLLYGNCFTFNQFTDEINSTQIKHLSKSGKMFGLQLDLFVGSNQTNYNSIFDQGAHIFINNQTEKNDIFGSFDDGFGGFDASVGFQTNIAIQRLFINKRAFPYSECHSVENTFDYSKLGKYFMNLNFKYNQKICLTLCYQKFLIEKCQCYDPNLQNLSKSRPCVNLSDFECMKNTSFSSQSQSNIIECNHLCPPECQSFKYSFTSSQIDYPSKGFADLMKLDPRIQEKFNYSLNISYEDLKRSLVSLNIYYDDLGYISIEEMPKINYIDLCFIIYGNIGLFLGLSILSIFEIFEVFFLLLKIIFEKLTKTDQIKPL